MREGLTPLPLPAEHYLLVEDGTDQTLDADVGTDKTYEYMARRVVRIAVGSQTLELDGQFSTPVQVNAAGSLHP